MCVRSKHVAPLDKPGKRYRGVHADVFVIADEDDENGTYSVQYRIAIRMFPLSRFSRTN